MRSVFDDSILMEQDVYLSKLLESDEEDEEDGWMDG